MKKKIVIGLISAFFCLSETSAFAAKECIALTNYSSIAVEFDSLVSPGESYIVQSKDSATLSGDHMVGACNGSNDNCVVTISAVDHSDTLIIHDLPRGALIIYGGSSQYYLDKNAHVACR